MKNVEMSVEGNILIVKVDLSKEFGPYSSAKTIIIASTEGNVSIPGEKDKKIGLNVYQLPLSLRHPLQEDHSGNPVTSKDEQSVISPGPHANNTDKEFLQFLVEKGLM